MSPRRRRASRRARGRRAGLGPEPLAGPAFPDARDLDAAVPERPALARRVDGHAVWVNSAALAAAGIVAATRDPDGGRILRRPDGIALGRLRRQRDEPRRPRRARGPSDATSSGGSLAASRACAALGLTEVQDASGYGPESLAALERLAARGALPIRVYATVSAERIVSTAPFARGVRIGKGATS